jgi:hypothetical protein
MTTATTTRARTRTIAGHRITLDTGRRYLATRPVARRGVRAFDVSIQDIAEGYSIHAEPKAVVRGLTYERANRLLRLFNNGASSFAGRMWD